MSESRLLGIVVTYKRPSELGQSLAALVAQTRRLDRLIVVNNEPGSDVRAVVEQHPLAAGTVSVIDTPDNLGPAGGIASGMEALLQDASDTDFVVVFDDDDPVVDNEVLADLAVAAAAGGPRLGGVGLRGAVLDRRTGRLRPPSMAGSDAAPSARVDYLKSGWTPLYSVRAIREIGPFDAGLFFGFDDLEFGLRLVDAGYLLEAHELGREQADPPSTPSLGYRRAEWRTYYTVRNLVIVLRRHASPSAVALTVLLQGVAKPLFNLLRGPRSGWPQCRMAWTAIWHATIGRHGRTVSPETAKTNPPRRSSLTRQALR
jgi:glycosyltransferase involved in cell wall biosynthesis